LGLRPSGYDPTRQGSGFFGSGFELLKKGRYPGFLSELAESFGMMMVKVEARKFRLKEIIEDLEQDRVEPYEDSGR